MFRFRRYRDRLLQTATVPRPIAGMVCAGWLSLAVLGIGGVFWWRGGAAGLHAQPDRLPSVPSRKPKDVLPNPPRRSSADVDPAARPSAGTERVRPVTSSNGMPGEARPPRRLPEHWQHARPLNRDVNPSGNRPSDSSQHGEALEPLTADARANAVDPLVDDANLHDVEFVGPRLVWAVGDRGAVWKSEDGGASWQMIPTPVRVPLRSVHFVTDQIGWIAGGGVRPHSRIPAGVVLFTSNGGRSWRVTREDGLPVLTYIRFFGRQRGIAVGSATQENPTGFLATEDGGQTWSGLPGERQPGWRTAAFRHPQMGLVAGTHGQVKLIGGEQVLATQTGNLGLRTVHDIHLAADEHAWLVGDGGLILHSENGGVTWTSPRSELPQALRDRCDLLSVCQRGTHVWLAGRPGGVIWHSPDRGASWQKQFTGQTVPLRKIRFFDEQQGVAVGCFGLILRTTNGGETWQAVRGAQRRAAYMVFASQPERVSFPLLTTLSGARGYRGVVQLPARRDAGVHRQLLHDFDLRFSQAVTAVGGGAAEIGWQWPIDKPELDRNMAALVAEWNLRSDGKFAPEFLESLVCTLRTWRPSVLILDHAGDADAFGRLLSDAFRHAVKQAADPTAYLHHQELAGLQPWQVAHVYHREPHGSTAHAEIDPQKYEAVLKTAAAVPSARARSLILQDDSVQFSREAYRQTQDYSPGTNGVNVHREFFQGLEISPGSAARRVTVVPELADRQAQEKRYRAQRNFRAYAQQSLGNSRKAAALLAELRPHLSRYSATEAADQLWQLAMSYEHESRTDLVEATLIELVTQYPNQEIALRGMEWLFQYWSSAETAYHRQQQTQVSSSSLQTDLGDVNARIQQAFRLAQQPELALTGSAKTLAGPDPVAYLTNAGRLRTGTDDTWRDGSIKHWQEQALRMAALIRKRSPTQYAQPGVQFPLANLLRRREVHGLADSYYRRFESLNPTDRWQQTAAAELWLNSPLGQPPKTVVQVEKTATKPRLDATLADDCWQTAKIMPLKVVTDDASAEPNTPAGGTGFVMLSYDDEFLYLAMSLPKDSRVRYDDVQLAGRTHDADLTGFDRVSFSLDIDRDYSTWYTFEVDQRGQTREACWHDSTFNPQWFVAAEDDETRWRIEAAIPLKRLSARPPQRGTVWALGVLRTLPGVGWQSWTLPAAAVPMPASFGLVRFQ